MVRTWIVAGIVGACLWLSFQIVEEHFRLRAGQEALLPLKYQKKQLQANIAEEEEYLYLLCNKDERTMMRLARERGYHGAGEINWRVLQYANQWWDFTK